MGSREVIGAIRRSACGLCAHREQLRASAGSHVSEGKQLQRETTVEHRIDTNRLIQIKVGVKGRSTAQRFCGCSKRQGVPSNEKTPACGGLLLMKAKPGIRFRSGAPCGGSGKRLAAGSLRHFPATPLYFSRQGLSFSVNTDCVDGCNPLQRKSFSQLHPNAIAGAEPGPRSRGSNPLQLLLVFGRHLFCGTRFFSVFCCPLCRPRSSAGRCLLRSKFGSSSPLASEPPHLGAVAAGG